jgi:hypothetical protein
VPPAIRQNENKVSASILMVGFLQLWRDALSATRRPVRRKAR